MPFLDWLHDDDGVRFVRRAVVVLLVFAFIVMLARGASRPADPSLGPPVGPAPTTIATLPSG